MTKLSLVSLALLGVVFPCPGSRKARRSRQNASSTNDAELGLSIDENSVLRSLGAIEPEDVMVEAIEALGDVDWSGGDIGGELSSVALSLFGSTLSMVNPLLGAAFSVFAGVMGWDGADDNAKLVREIIAEVDKMITQSLASFSNDLTEADLSGLMNVLDKDRPDWTFAANKFVYSAPKVFNTSCWNGDRDRCLDWRTKRGAARALVYEIHFTDLMLQSRAVMLKDRKRTEAEHLREEIVKASGLIDQHVSDWSSYRDQDKWFVRGRWQEAGPGYTILQGKDTMLHSGDQKDKNARNTEFTGGSCVASVKNHRRRASYPDGNGFSYQHFGRRRAPQNELQNRINRCFEEWRKAVRAQLSKFRREADAIKRVKNFR